VNSLQSYLDKRWLVVNAPHFVAVVHDHALGERAAVITSLGYCAVFIDGGVAGSVTLKKTAAPNIDPKMRTARSVFVEMKSTCADKVGRAGLSERQSCPVTGLPVKAAGWPRGS
jgi:hypothetical protein